MPSKSIRSLFTLPGFVAAYQLSGIFCDRYTHVITLRRWKILTSVRAVNTIARGDNTNDSCGYIPPPVPGWRIYVKLEHWHANCPRCGCMHVEHVEHA